jgi:predicted nuclease of restriction endonuclease-like (RecB) superfamily
MRRVLALALPDPQYTRPMSNDTPVRPESYAELLEDLKRRIGTARVAAALAVNRELVLLYWSIGRDILLRQEHEGWGAKVIDQLARDLRKAFPDVTGFSTRNLLFMRSFAQAWGDEEIVKQAVSQIPWGHNIRLIQKVKDPSEREWYARACVVHGWSRAVLEAQIDTGLYRRQGRALTNVARTLPAEQSELAQQTLKDPYCFEFLGLAADITEHELHRSLIHNLRDFLLELGRGFAFIGNEYRFEVGGDEFRIDLLFYHTQLHCYVVLELKTEAFRPEHVGQLQFYLSSVDRFLRGEVDGPTIGILLCSQKNEVVVEVALQDSAKPMGVAEYRLTEALPKHVRDALPALEELKERVAQASSTKEAKPGAAEDTTAEPTTATDGDSYPTRHPS